MFSDFHKPHIPNFLLCIAWFGEGGFLLHHSQKDKSTPTFTQNFEFSFSFSNSLIILESTNQQLYTTSRESVWTPNEKRDENLLRFG